MEFNFIKTLEEEFQNETEKSKNFKKVTFEATKFDDKHKFFTLRLVFDKEIDIRQKKAHIEEILSA